MEGAPFQTLNILEAHSYPWFRVFGGGGFNKASCKTPNSKGARPTGKEGFGEVHRMHPTIAPFPILCLDCSVEMGYFPCRSWDLPLFRR
jgi:hypothetical protein